MTLDPTPSLPHVLTLLTALKRILAEKSETAKNETAVIIPSDEKKLSSRAVVSFPLKDQVGLVMVSFSVKVQLGVVSWVSFPSETSGTFV